MELVLAFGVVLLVSVLVSERARTTVLSTSVMFLAAGFAIGPGGLGWVDLTLEEPLVARFAELALFAILFVEGAGLDVHEVGRAWRLPGRALLFGLPLTLAFIAVAGHLVLGMTWTEAFLVGAILSPTDPVFAVAILEHEAVPLRLRRLLALEADLNDGLALPIVLVLLSMAGRRALDPLTSLGEAGLGIAIGAAVPWVFLWLERRRFFEASLSYLPLAGVGIAATILGLCRAIGANEFLAAFASGVTLATARKEAAEQFARIGVPAAELLKLAALLAFGALLSRPLFADLGWRGYAFAALSLLLARPLALLLAFVRSELDRREWLAAAWFGPKGFASILYAFLMVDAGIPRAGWLFEVVALVAVLSIVAHSSTDVVVARVFREEEEKQGR